MRDTLLKLVFGAILVIGFVLMRLDNAAVKFGDNVSVVGRNAVDATASLVKEHGADAASYGWDVTDIVRELREADDEVNEWSVFYKAYSRSVSSTIKLQDMSRWCEIVGLNGWERRLKSLHKITFEDLASRGVTLPQHADDSNSVDFFVKKHFDRSCLAYKAERILFSGYPEEDLDGLLLEHPEAESMHATYMKLMKTREQRILDLAQKLAGADGNAADFMQQARSQWVEMVGKPGLEKFRQQQKETMIRAGSKSIQPAQP